MFFVFAFLNILIYIFQKEGGTNFISANNSKPLDSEILSLLNQIVEIWEPTEMGKITLDDF